MLPHVLRCARPARAARVGKVRPVHIQPGAAHKLALSDPYTHFGALAALLVALHGCSTSAIMTAPSAGYCTPEALTNTEEMTETTNMTTSALARPLHRGMGFDRRTRGFRERMYTLR